jgi:hypothetical protein
MSEKKELKGKAIKIQNKLYVQVKDRILFFNEKYENGCIKTEVISDDGSEIVFKAIAIPDVSNIDRAFIGTASGVRGGQGVDKTSAVENAETSAVGRALAMMGIGVLESVASADEINKSSTQTYKQAKSGSKATVYGDNKGDKCSECGDSITDKVANYSLDKYGKKLCFNCQNK